MFTKFVIVSVTGKKRQFFQPGVKSQRTVLLGHPKILTNAIKNVVGDNLHDSALAHQACPAA